MTDAPEFDLVLGQPLNPKRIGGWPMNAPHPSRMGDTGSGCGGHAGLQEVSSWLGMGFLTSHVSLECLGHVDREEENDVLAGVEGVSQHRSILELSSPDALLKC